MIRYRHSLLTASLALALGGCFRLDDFVYNNQALDAYLLDGYTGPRELDDLPAAYDVAPEYIHLFTLRSNDNGDVQTIHAIYLGDPARIATDTVILYCHGNKYHMDQYWNRAKLLAHTGGAHHYGVLMLDYRGFGMSGGEPSETGMYADVEAAVDWLEQNGLTGDRLVMYGYSLGSAPATELTAHPRGLRPSWLILEAPFGSAEIMVQDASALALPASYFTNLSINNAEEIRLVHQPFCWIHGREDDFLSIDTHGEVVYANHPGTQEEAHRVAGGAHNDVPRAMGYAHYAHTLDRFIRNY